MIRIFLLSNLTFLLMRKLLGKEEKKNRLETKQLKIVSLWVSSSTVDFTLTERRIEVIRNGEVLPRIFDMMVF